MPNSAHSTGQAAPESTQSRYALERAETTAVQGELITDNILAESDQQRLANLIHCTFELNRLWRSVESDIRQHDYDLYLAFSRCFDSATLSAHFLRSLTGGRA